jgi:hypothetical protein
MKTQRWMIALWLLLPIPVIAYHFGPGRRWLARDDARALVRDAARAEAADPARAAALYRQAAARLGPGDDDARARCELRAAAAQAGEGDAAGAIESLDRMLAAPSFDALPATVRDEARALSARTHYYAAWVMRLEGATRDEWVDIAETARQNFRLLAEAGGDAADEHSRSLEATVRLERMSLAELMARPLPKECESMCKKGLCKKMSQCKSGKKPGNKPGRQPQDARDKPERGAGIVRFSEGGGS